MAAPEIVVTTKNGKRKVNQTNLREIIRFDKELQLARSNPDYFDRWFVKMITQGEDLSDLIDLYRGKNFTELYQYCAVERHWVSLIRDHYREIGIVLVLKTIVDFAGKINSHETRFFTEVLLECTGEQFNEVAIHMIRERAYSLIYKYCNLMAVRLNEMMELALGVGDIELAQELLTKGADPRLFFK